mmetsp:Transcript_1341/g.2170  ORF Transcript_1341/g.2170 Transcript_1341/m.2170 type:complete len:355 (+) Transcript_1341:82-1146(+)|eukprot:CAMPEP_0185033598 /NCGR_PEP_ID=MMETSP1103-20130426/22685_1 /TAXON_ID=36769 /ORGANISM="Paraphysomonas bandaiensis, Strain Caron Lab Isolate" /LENGTH=354 /DNA_ID=CAMNT_0027569931 /DNA_START=30 /DNA_END=1094 /DNA_ORIENTATION=-
MQKREPPTDVENEISKKAKYEVAVVPPSQSQVTVTDEKRTSNLAAPTMLLTGHEGAVYSICFDSSGQHLASGSMDNNIFLWNTYGECENYNVLSGHKNAVLEVQWGTNNTICSCSADKSVGLWDSNKGSRLRKLSSHSGIVNSCSMARDAPEVFASGSDDCSVVIWDARDRNPVMTIPHQYQVTSVCMVADGGSVYSGGIDNVIRRWDLRKVESFEPELVLEGHTNSITGLCLSFDESYLLSNGMDSGLFAWDVRPFVPDGESRLRRKFTGARHGAEQVLLRCSWSPTDSGGMSEKVACGSADRIVHIWDAESTEQLYYLPGHKGSVNQVIFHPHEPIVGSCGSDKQIFLGELS